MPILLAEGAPVSWIETAYPGGSRQQFSNPDHLAWKQQPCKLVLHTTEGGGYPSAATYDNGRRAPHFTVDPWARSWRQHYSLAEAAWALKATPLVSTNTMGAVQVEIIGTCDPTNGALATKYVPALRGDNLAWLTGLLRTIAGIAGIPWEAPGLTWIAYPASYGTGAVQRLSPAAWTTYRGLIGHQHVPGNTHGDPGALPIAEWLGTTQEDEDDMFSDADRAKLDTDHYAINKIILPALSGIASRVAKLAADDGTDSAEIVAGVLAGLSPEKIAAAIPATIAEQVIDALGQKIVTRP